MANEKNQKLVVDKIHEVMDETPEAAVLLSTRAELGSRLTVLEFINEILEPLGVGPLAAMVDAEGAVIGVGVRRRAKNQSNA